MFKDPFHAREKPLYLQNTIEEYSKVTYGVQVGKAMNWKLQDVSIMRVGLPKDVIINQCDMSGNKTKNTFLELYRKVENGRFDETWKKDGNVARVAYYPSSQHSFDFKISFTIGQIEKELLTDQFADEKFNSEDLSKELDQELPANVINFLDPPHINSVLTREPCPCCHRQGKLDVFLRVRHDINLVHENIVQKVTEEDWTVSNIGRSALKTFGCDNRGKLFPAKDK